MTDKKTLDDVRRDSDDAPPEPGHDKPGDDDNDNDVDWKSRFERERAKNEDIIKNRQKTKDKNKQLQDRIEALESKLEGGDKGTKKDQTEAWKAERDELQQKIESLKQREQRRLLEQPFYERADEFVKLPAAIRLGIDGLAVDDEDGEPKVIVKDKPWEDVNDYLDRFIEENPFLAKNKRIAGTGNQGAKGDTGGKLTEIPSHYYQMTREQRAKFRREHPELTEEFKKSSNRALNVGTI